MMMETDLNTKYEENEMPTVVWTEPNRKLSSGRKIWTPGLTKLLRGLAVGEAKCLDGFNRNAVPATSKAIGIRTQTTTGTDGKVYVRRIE